MEFKCPKITYDTEMFITTYGKLAASARQIVKPLLKSTADNKMTILENIMESYGLSKDNKIKKSWSKPGMSNLLI